MNLILFEFYYGNSCKTDEFLENMVLTMKNLNDHKNEDNYINTNLWQRKSIIVRISNYTEISSNKVKNCSLNKKVTMKILSSIVGPLVLMRISTGFCKTLKSGNFYMTMYQKKIFA